MHGKTKNQIYAFNRGNRKNTMRKVLGERPSENKGKQGKIKNERKRKNICAENMIESLWDPWGLF